MGSIEPWTAPPSRSEHTNLAEIGNRRLPICKTCRICRFVFAEFVVFIKCFSVFSFASLRKPRCMANSVSRLGTKMTISARQIQVKKSLTRKTRLQIIYDYYMQVIYDPIGFPTPSTVLEEIGHNWPNKVAISCKARRIIAPGNVTRKQILFDSCQ